MTFSKKIFFWSSILLLLGGGFFLWLGREIADSPKVTIRIGLNTWPGYEPLFIAAEKGFLQNETIQIQLVPYSSLHEVQAAFEQQQIDGMATTIAELIYAYARTKRLGKIVLVTNFSSGADVLISHQEIDSMQDLKGKKVAIEEFSVGEYFIFRALENHNMSLKDIELVKMDPKRFQQSLQDKSVAAVVTYPPYSVALLRQENIHTLYDSNRVQAEIFDVISVDKSLLEKHPHIATLLKEGWNKGIEYTHLHSDESHRFMERQLKISSRELKEVLSKITFIPKETQKAFLFPKGKLEYALEMMGRLVSKNSPPFYPLPSMRDFIAKE